jgi:hypothetical protein
VTGSEVVRLERELVTREGECVDVLDEPDKVAAYLEELDQLKRQVFAEIRRVEEIVLPLMDAGTMRSLPLKGGGELEKDPVDHGSREWDDQVLMRLYDKAPDDPELSAAYKERLRLALRPEYRLSPLVVKLRQLAAERPDLAGIIADAERAKRKPRHLHVKRPNR